MRKGFVIMVAAATLAVGCSRDIEPHTGDDTADTEDTDTNTDTDTSDTDTDTDTDTSGPQLDCQADYAENMTDPGTLGQFDDCVSQEIACGDRIFGTTQGGSTYYGDTWNTGTNDTEPYTHFLQCIGNDDIDDSYDAPERVFYFDARDVSGSTEIRLDAKCGDLTMKLLRSVECPPKDVQSTLCESGFYDADERYRDDVAPGYEYVIVVDGLNNFVGNFELTVDCSYN